MRTRIFNGKEQIFCEWRHRWVRLTPEEWVRQQLLHRLVEQLGYPAALIAVEAPIKVGKMQKRCDAIVYNNVMQPLMLIECKAETVSLTQKTLDQAATYNRKLQVPYLILHNGPQTIIAYVNDKSISFVQSIPPYNQL
ncbi:MAG: type I restriction enzyme HsdR N-terminal domain-containing protein [Paludibacteraceae bacterium]|nr:type I restriction enzyme HsdR N-terminal domain-containing protein [Paludibacteraceae bacterium]